MKLKGKVILIIATCLFVFGIALTGIGVLLGGHPGFTLSRLGLHSVSQKTESYHMKKTKLPDFSKADFSLDYAEVEIEISEDDHYYLEYKLDGSNGKPSYSVKGTTFTFLQREDSISFINFGFFISDTRSSDAYVRLYVPKDKALDYVQVENESGGFVTNNLKVDSIDLDLDYGACEIKDSDFNFFTISMESGEVDIQNTRAGIFSFDGDYGEVSLKEFSSDSASFDMESTGVYLDAAKLGDLDYTNEYGDFTLFLPEALENYSFDVSAEYSEIDLPSDAPDRLHTDSDDGVSYYQTKGKGNRNIRIESESGDITIQKR